MVLGSGGGSACCGAGVKILGDLTLRAPTGPRGGRGGWTPPPQVDGRDHVPTEWSGYCPAPAPTLPGVAVDRSANVSLERGAVVEGSPPVLEDPGLDASLTGGFGGTTYAALAAGADIVFSGFNTRLRGWIRPSARQGACDTGDDQNWGAPLTPGSACWDYLPVIHATGNLDIDARGEGQGILLVDGDLTVSGAFDFYGIVVVKGRVTMGDGGITGSLLVGNNAGTGGSEIGDGATVHYAACASARATARTGGARFLPGRHWFEVP